MDPRLGIQIEGPEGYFLMEYDTFITTENGSDMFVPVDAEDIEDEELGYVVYQRLDDETLDCFQFFPFGHEPQEEFPQLLGKGLADRIQLMIARDLREELSPEVRVYQGGNGTSMYRNRQLDRLGLTPGRGYSLGRMVELMESKVRQ